MEKIKFVLLSTRFWAIVGIAVVGFLKGDGIIDTAIADSLIVILGGYTGIKTLQHFQ
jgi:hypothetical protein